MSFLRNWFSLETIRTTATGRRWSRSLDRSVRERGTILREANQWHLWYTGYNDDRSKIDYLVMRRPTMVFVGLDGRQSVTRSGGRGSVRGEARRYLLSIRRSRDDIAHWMTSEDRVTWTEQGKSRYPHHTRRADSRRTSRNAHGLA